MHRYKLLVLFLILLVSGWLLFRSNTNVGQDFRALSNQLSSTATAGQGDNYLVNLERLSAVLYYIDSSYVEPKRVSSDAMFKQFLEDIGQPIPEVQTIFPGKRQAIVKVNTVSREFDLRVMNLHGLKLIISDVLRFIRAHTITNITDSELEVLAIKSVLTTLDPHSTYLSPEEYRDMRVDASGQFGGLGIVIGIRKTKLTVIGFAGQNTPAKKAGLEANDHIIKIGAETTENMLLTDAVKRMRGAKGTSITLAIMRQGWPAPRSFTLTRDTIEVDSVSSLLLPNGIGYLRVSNFEQKTTRNMQKHLSALASENNSSLNGLILDLRGDPGGVLDQAIEVTDLFLNSGTIVTTVGNNDRQRDVQKAKKSKDDVDLPLIVLVDSGSASASEIVAGTLQHLERAIILGQTTFGKGTVQRLYDLPEGAALKLTVAQYLAAGDRSIQSIGITPDIETHPALMTRERFHLFPKKDVFGESSLDRHFEFSKPNLKTKVQQESAKLRVTYVQEIEEDGPHFRLTLGDTPEQMREKLLKDFEVSLARRVLEKAPSAKTDDLLSVSASTIVQAKAEQDLILQQKLGERDIDWSVAQSPSASCLAKDGLRITAVTKNTSINDALVAGETAQLHLTVHNTSQCTFHQMWIVAESDQYLLNGPEFLFGKISPQEKITRQLEIKVPKFTPSGLLQSTLKLRVSHEKTEPLYTHALYIPVNGLTLPHFSMKLDAHDGKTVATQNNGNGIAEKGEVLAITVNVKNLAAYPIEEASVALEARSSAPLDFVTGHAPIRQFKSQEMRALRFVVNLPQDQGNDLMEFFLLIKEFDLGTSVQKILGLQLGQKPDFSGAYFEPPTLESNLGKALTTPVRAKFLPISGVLRDNEGVQDMFISVNQNKVYYQHFGNYPKTNDLKPVQPFSTTVPLDLGQNYIVIGVRDSHHLLNIQRFILQRLDH